MSNVNEFANNDQPSITGFREMDAAELVHIDGGFSFGFVVASSVARGQAVRDAESHPQLDAFRAGVQRFIAGT